MGSGLIVGSVASASLLDDVRAAPEASDIPGLSSLQLVPSHTFWQYGLYQGCRTLRLARLVQGDAHRRLRLPEGAHERL